MWEQQLLSETSAAFQLEAAAALGALLPQQQQQQQQQRLSSEDPVKSHAAIALSKALASHRWHPFFRARAAFSLARLHNTGGEEAAAAWKALANYISSFHSEAVLDAEANEVMSPPESGEGMSSGDCGLSSSSSSSAAAAAAAATAAAAAAAPASDGLRLSYYACTAPESRFLRYFFAAVSLIRDTKGL
ncbi:bromodomain-containing protein, putative [Eimeria praecox]|uniref:Bromodomain-containing protein, putative n=1 Tax=Eimeria praecox TaxID=51316 RepID=U6GJF9_9EIME|nr:bromodomain-containing protein, putative [Eimeria praecox]